MAGVVDRIRDFLQKDRPEDSESKTQSGRKVKTRTEKMCEAGDQTACDHLERMRSGQSTDSNN